MNITDTGASEGEMRSSKTIVAKICDHTPVGRTELVQIAQIMQIAASASSLPLADTEIRTFAHKTTNQVCA